MILYSDEKENMKAALCFAVLLLVVILVLYWQGKAENFETIYLNQMANENWDPIYFKYNFETRDVAGMSDSDWYLENEMNYLNGWAPGYMEGNAAFVAHDDYIRMPPQYRPKPPRKMDGTKVKSVDTVPNGAAAHATIMQSGPGNNAERDMDMRAASMGSY